MLRNLRRCCTLFFPNAVRCDTRFSNDLKLPKSTNLQIHGSGSNTYEVNLFLAKKSKIYIIPGYDWDLVKVSSYSVDTLIVKLPTSTYMPYFMENDRSSGELYKNPSS